MTKNWGAICIPIADLRQYQLKCLQALSAVLEREPSDLVKIDGSFLRVPVTKDDKGRRKCTGMFIQSVPLMISFSQVVYDNTEQFYMWAALLDNEQKNMFRSALNVMGFGYVQQWPKNFMLSQQAMSILLANTSAKLLMTHVDGQVIAGGAVVVPASEISENIYSASFLKSKQGISLSSFLLSNPEY